MMVEKLIQQGVWNLLYTAFKHLFLSEIIPPAFLFFGSALFVGLPEITAGDETYEDLCLLRQGNSKYGEVVGNSVLHSVVHDRLGLVSCF